MSELPRITERYRLDKLIAASDTASVFRAADLRSGETVALKLIRGPIDEPRRDGSAQLESAAVALAACRHQSLPRFLDFGFTGAGNAYLVTEYLQGAGFEVLAGSTAGRSLPLLLPVLDGLEELDCHQLAHRNLRLDNLLLVPHGDGERLVLLGWGSSTLGAGEEGRRADLRGFAELSCAAIGAEIEREPSFAVTLPPGAGGDPIAGAELAMLLGLLLQPGTGAPASLYSELRRALRQAMAGTGGPGEGSAGEGSAGEGSPGAAAQTLDLAQTSAVAADVTIAVPREPLLGALDRFAAAGRMPEGGGAAAADETNPALDIAASSGRAALNGTRAPAITPARLAVAVPPLPPRPAPMDDATATAATMAAAVELLVAGSDAAGAAAPASATSGTAAPAGDAPGTATGEIRGDTLPAFRVADLVGDSGRGAGGAVQRSRGVFFHRLHRRPRLAALAGMGVAAAVILLVAVLLFLHRPAMKQKGPAADGRAGATSLVAAAPLPSARLPAPAPAPVPPKPGGEPRLAAAQALLASGDAAGARRELAQISADRLAALPADERAAYDQLTAALAADRRRQIAADLAAALRRGDIRRVGAALTAAKWEPDLPAPVRRDLDRARQAVELDARLKRIDLARDPQEGLRTASGLLALLPRDQRAGELREQAAKTIEEKVDAALVGGDAEGAAALLDGLRQAWPDRPGLQDRANRIEALRHTDAQLENVLAAASRAEAAGQPLQGLELLAGASPGPRYRERFRLQRERLERLLAKLDAAPPSIALRPGWKPEYDKGATIAVPLRITDDLAVKSAELWVRPEGAAAYQLLPVRHLGGADWQADIPPQLHQNRTLEVYAVASDHSGHRSLLASQDQPLKLKRRNWIEKMLSGKGGE